MNRFAELLDRLAYEHGRNAKLRLMTEFFRMTPDPERGYALAALTGALSFPHAKPGLIRALIAERTDPVLFDLSYDYVGDLSETVALMWPTKAPSQAGFHPPPRGSRGRGTAHGAVEGANDVRPESAPSTVLRTVPLPRFTGEDEDDRRFLNENADADQNANAELGVTQAQPSLTEVVATLASLGKAELPGQIARWLDALDETGRWALLKLVTGALRVGVSARLAKTAVAALGGKDPDEIEILWPALTPPYVDLFAWVEGRTDKPLVADPAPFRPPMLSHAIEASDFAKLDPAEYVAEWKWDGIRVQAVAGLRPDGGRVARLYSRTGEDISAAFPDLVDAFAFDGALDGELLIMREGEVQSFAVLQQRLNRKTVTPQLLAEFPAHLRVYDLLTEAGEDLRGEPLRERRGTTRSVHRRGCRLRASTSRRSSLSPAGTRWRGRARTRRRPAPGSMHMRSKA